MERPYQIEDRRAMQRFEAALGSRQAPVQLVLPAMEILTAMRAGVGELIRRAGLELMCLLMEQEVEELVGKRSVPSKERTAYRWGKDDGWCRIDGQKVPLKRPRARQVDGREVQLGSYLCFQQDPQFGPKLWWEVLRGLSTRNYGRTVRRFAEAYGIEKSAVSEHFIEASRRKLRELLERDLSRLELCAVMLDGISFDGETFVVALGIGQDGRKTVLGLRQGASENAVVADELCADLERRGLDFQQARLYVLDGARALAAAVRKRAGQAALIQRCHLHKRRNVLGHLPDQHQPFIEQKLIAAWAMSSYEEARRALDGVRLELERINPSAARSLAEGLEETLTIHRLGVPEALRKTLFSTNPIESALSVVEDKCRRVKKWQGGDMKLRWVASGLLFAEEQFRRVKGYRDIPQLVAAIKALASGGKLPVVAAARRVG
ncbi:MAG: IS256 family transposase [Nitrospiraceae bacterium]|nr:MAG: IS256 family transposase [Nitrospiraceae bacterium]GIW56446.1 MAG: IS256 family transposase [Nitrospiraceae bacterium]